MPKAKKLKTKTLKKTKKTKAAVRGRGRPHKLTAKMHKSLVEIVQAGNYHVTAAHMCGISEDTFSLWMRNGWALAQLGEGATIPAKEIKYLNFFRDIKKAESIVESQLVGLILSATVKDWKAGMTYLERKSPDRWGRRDRTTIDGQLNIKTIKDMSTEELEDIVQDK